MATQTRHIRDLISEAPVGSFQSRVFNAVFPHRHPRRLRHPEHRVHRSRHRQDIRPCSSGANLDPDIRDHWDDARRDGPRDPRRPVRTTTRHPRLDGPVRGLLVRRRLCHIALPDRRTPLSDRSGHGRRTPTLLALAAEYSPMRWRGAVMTGVLLGLPAGAMLGSLVASAWLPTLGWQGIFMLG